MNKSLIAAGFLMFGANMIWVESFGDRAIIITLLFLAGVVANSARLIISAIRQPGSQREVSPAPKASFSRTHHANGSPIGGPTGPNA